MLCFLDTTFLGGSESESREVLAAVSRDANTSSSSRFSVKSSNQPLWQISQQVSLNRYGVLIIIL